MVAHVPRLEEAQPAGLMAEGDLLGVVAAVVRPVRAGAPPQGHAGEGTRVGAAPDVQCGRPGVGRHGRREGLEGRVGDLRIVGQTRGHIGEVDLPRAPGVVAVVQRRLIARLVLPQVRVQSGHPGRQVRRSVHHRADVDRRQAVPVLAAHRPIVASPTRDRIVGHLLGCEAGIVDQGTQGVVVGDAVLVDLLLGADHVLDEAGEAYVVDGLDVGHVAGVEREDVDRHGGLGDGRAQLGHRDVVVARCAVPGEAAPAVAVVTTHHGEVLGGEAGVDLPEEPGEGLARAEVSVGPGGYYLDVVTRDLEELHALLHFAIVEHDHDVHVRVGRQRLERRQRELLPAVHQVVVAIVVDGVGPGRFGARTRSSRRGRRRAGRRGGGSKRGRAGRGGQAATAGQGEPYENKSAHRDEDNKTFQLVLLDVPFNEATYSHRRPEVSEGTA